MSSVLLSYEVIDMFVESNSEPFDEVFPYNKYIYNIINLNKLSIYLHSQCNKIYNDFYF